MVSIRIIDSTSKPVQGSSASALLPCGDAVSNGLALTLRLSHEGVSHVSFKGFRRVVLLVLAGASLLPERVVRREGGILWASQTRVSELTDSRGDSQDALTQAKS